MTEELDRPGPTADAAAEQPSQVRFFIVLVTFLAAFLLYLHRFCFSYAQRYIKEDLGLSNEQFGYCISAFFFAYALAQVPSGWLSDRFGARRMLSIYIIVWSLFTVLMGFTVGLIMLIVFRMATGLGQAGAYPTSASLVSKWVPFTSRGTANGCIAFGGRLGVGVTPILTAYLIVMFVPVGHSSLLSRDDLLDVHELCFQLQRHDAVVIERLNDGAPVEQAARGRSSASKSNRAAQHRVLGLLSPNLQTSVHDLAVAYADALAEKRSEIDGYDVGRYDRAVSQSLQPADAATVARLVEELNAVLVDAEFYRPADFENISIEREAEKLLQRPVDARSETETQRLNRLLLEALFPNSIRKIYVNGWRPVMFVFGSLGVVVAGVFWFYFRDWPAEHPGCNAAEIELIERGRPNQSQTPHGTVNAVPIRAILRSRSLWLMCINQWGGNVGWVFLVTWLPRYLFEVHSVPLVQRGWMAAIPLWVGWCGMLSGGWLTDRITGRFGLRWRTTPIVFGRFLGASAYLACLLHPSAWTVTALFAVVAFSADVSNPSSWAYKQDVGGRYVGSIHGWANMWGNFGATVSPILLQAVIVSQYGWDAAFTTCAAAFLIAGIAALGVDARIPIVVDDAEAGR